jgi:gas vesicle protein
MESIIPANCPKCQGLLTNDGDDLVCINCRGKEGGTMILRNVISIEDLLFKYSALSVNDLKSKIVDMLDTKMKNEKDESKATAYGVLYTDISNLDLSKEEDYTDAYTKISDKVKSRVRSSLNKWDAECMSAYKDKVEKLKEKAKQKRNEYWAQYKQPNKPIPKETLDKIEAAYQKMLSNIKEKVQVVKDTNLDSYKEYKAFEEMYTSLFSYFQKSTKEIPPEKETETGKTLELNYPKIEYGKPSIGPFTLDLNEKQKQRENKQVLESLEKMWEEEDYTPNWKELLKQKGVKKAPKGEGDISSVSQKDEPGFYKSI